MELGEIESRIDDKKVVFHKPNNHGFVAVGEESIYVAREPDGAFEFEEIHREAVRTILVQHREEYEPPVHYDEEAEKVTDEGRNYAEIRVTLASKVVAVTVEECPRDVARALIDADL